MGYDELPEFLLPLLSESRHNGFLASFSLIPPYGSGGVLLSMTLFWATVDAQLLLVPLMPLRTDFPKQQKGGEERRGINKAFPEREFLNTPFLPLKSLSTSPQHPLPLLSSKGKSDSEAAILNSSEPTGNDSMSLC